MRQTSLCLGGVSLICQLLDDDLKLTTERWHGEFANKLLARVGTNAKDQTEFCLE